MFFIVISFNKLIVCCLILLSQLSLTGYTTPDLAYMKWTEVISPMVPTIIHGIEKGTVTYLY